jgi:hypothetical protein
MKYLSDDSDDKVGTRLAACEVLKAIGTEKSVPALEELAKVPFGGRQAADAIRAILDRARRGPG